MNFAIGCLLRCRSRRRGRARAADSSAGIEASSVERPMTRDARHLNCGDMETTIGPTRSPLLIGRDELLELADRRLDDVEAGRGQLLLVAGEAGIGKTRFLDAVWQKADERGFIGTGGWVAPQDHDVPAASILDMARSM